MSFIEELKRRRDKDQDELERNKLFLVTQKEEKARKNSQIKEEVNISNNVLDSAIVLRQLANELAEVIGSSVEVKEHGFGLRQLSIFIRDAHQSFRFGNGIKTWRESITINGNPDGTIQIGKNKLKPQDFNNPIQVDRALELAYKSPTISSIPDKDDGISY